MTLKGHGNNVLRARDLVVVRSKRTLLDTVDLEVNRTEHWALIGPNGAGKTTLINILAASNHPTRGTVDVLGHRLGRVDMRELRRLIGHVNPRHALEFPLTVAEIVWTGITGTIDLVPRWRPTSEQRTRAAELIRFVGLEHLSSARWDTLSQGERGRVLVARALIAMPPLLLLDEPATGLDVAAREQLIQTIDRLRDQYRSLSSVMVTHHLEDLPGSTTHAMLLRDGRVLAAGPVDAVLTSDLISACFDFPVEVTRSRGRWTARAQQRRTTVGCH